MNTRGNNLWSNLLFTEMVTHIPGTENEIFLTFDDGPTLGITDQVLALLSQYNAKATFFCKGKNVETNPDILKMVLSHGHLIGNHGYQHLHGWKTSTSTYVNDCLKAAEIIPEKIFRPPYGKITPFQYSALKKDFTIYLWTALSWDFHPWVSPNFCFKHLVRNLFPGSIMVFHDTEKALPKLLNILPQLLRLGTEKGFQFSVLPLKS